MENRLKHITTGLPFPNIPEKWTQEERRFAYGLRDLFDQLFARSNAYPVGVVVLTTEDTKPFTFGTWEELDLGLTGVHAWQRTAYGRQREE